MNIAEKTKRIITGEDSQHGTRSAPEQAKPAAIVRLRSLLRRQPESARAAETAYFTEPEAGDTFPATSSRTDASTDDSSVGQAPKVPKSRQVKPAKKAVAKRAAAKKAAAKK